MTQQRLVCFGRFHQPPHLAGNPRRNRHSIEQCHPIRRRRRDSIVRRHDAHQVQRVSRRDHDQLACRPLVAQLPEQPDGFSQGKLFPRHSQDESPPSNLAPRFESPEHLQQLEPPRSPRLPLQEIPKHHPPPPQQLPRPGGHSLGVAPIARPWSA